MFLGLLLAVTICIFGVVGSFVVGIGWLWTLMIIVGAAAFFLELRAQQLKKHRQTAYEEAAEKLGATRKVLLREIVGERRMALTDSRSYEVM